MSPLLLDQRFPDRKQIGLAVCCDWHLGSKQFRADAAEQWLNKIKENGWFVFLGGDLCENSLPTSVGSVMEQTMSPMKQMQVVVKMLEPITDQIIGAVSGNHGARTVRHAGIDPDAIISHDLGVPHFGHTMAGRIQVGKAHWKIAAHHGAGGGVLIGSKLNVADKLTKIYPMMDLYLVCHGHGDVAGSTRVFDVSVAGGAPKPKEVIKTRHMSMCGSLLDYKDSYAEAKLMPPASICQVVHMLGDRVHTSDAKDGDVYHKPYERVVHHF